MSARLRALAWPLLLLAVSLLPNPGAALPLRAYYFRDFSLTFFPQRAYFAGEIAAGRWPFWNPYLYEGSALLPFYYPVDLLHVLSASPVFVSWLLTLHLPLAALGMYGLARDLGASRPGAFVAGALFACGGLALSSLSLFVFLEALAWAPLTALLVRRAAVHGGRCVPLAGLAVAVSVSTLAVEFALQGVALGGLLGLAARPTRQGLSRLLAAAALSALLAALPILLTSGIVAESLRAPGITSFELLQRSAHPLSLVQVFVADLFGRPSEPFELRFWGRFFSDGPPYFTTYYLGPLALCLAAAGAGGMRPRERRLLLALAALALVYAAGRHLPLAPLLAPHLRFFRFPVKALLSAHMVATLLAGFGAERLARGAGRRASATAAAALAGLTGGLAAVLAARPFDVQAWLGIDDALAARALPLVARSAILSLVLAAGALGLVLAARRGLLSAPRSAALLVALALLDLARAGHGVNPQVPAAFYGLLPEIRAALGGLGALRAFSYGGEGSPALRARLDSRGPGLHLQAFFLTRQLVAPFTNLLDRVPLAEGIDRHGFIPNPSVIAHGGYDPAAADAILPALRNAAVARVLSLDRPQSAALRLLASVPTGLPGTSVQVYALEPTSPRDYVACRVRVEPDRGAAQARSLDEDFDPSREVVLEAPAAASCRSGAVIERHEAPGDQRYVVELDGDGWLVMRDAFTPSWRASVDGRAAAVVRANGRHRAVRLAAGRHAVRLYYEPPRLRAGLALTGLGVALATLLLARPAGRIALR